MKNGKEAGGFCPAYALTAFRFVVLVAIAAGALACATQKVPPPEVPTGQGFKTMKFGEFIGEVNERFQLLPFEVTIPASYERANLPAAPSDYSYWMPRERVKAVADSGDLPADTGFFYSKIAEGVAYDPEKKGFVGFDVQQLAEAMDKLGATNFKWERAELRGYPAIFYQFVNPRTKQLQHNAYIATLYEGIVFFISYVPPSADAASGEKAWSRFRAGLAGPSK